MLPLGLRAVTNTIIGYARDNAFPSICVFGRAPCLAPPFFTKTHFQGLLVLYNHSCYSIFFCLSHISQKLTFLWQGKDLLLFVNYIFSALCLSERDPAIRGA